MRQRKQWGRRGGPIEQGVSTLGSLKIEQVAGHLKAWYLGVWSTNTLVVDNLNDGGEVARVATVGQEDDTTDFNESEFTHDQPSAFGHISSLNFPRSSLS